MTRLGMLLGLVAVMVFVVAGSALAEEKAAKGGKGGDRGLMGEITKVEGNSITIKGRDAEQTVTVEEGTEITSEAAVKLEDVKVGDRIMVSSGGKRVYGEVTKIEGKTITVKGRSGEEQSITVEEGATITGRIAGKLEDLKVGTRVMVMSKDGKVARIGIMTGEAGGHGGKGGDKGGHKKTEEAPK